MDHTSGGLVMEIVSNKEEESLKSLPTLYLSVFVQIFWK